MSFPPPGGAGLPPMDEAAEEFRRQQMLAADHHQALYYQSLTAGGLPPPGAPPSYGATGGTPSPHSAASVATAASYGDPAAAAYGISAAATNEGPHQAAAMARIYAEQQRHAAHAVQQGLPPGYPPNPYGAQYPPAPHYNPYAAHAGTAGYPATAVAGGAHGYPATPGANVHLSEHPQHILSMGLTPHVPPQGLPEGVPGASPQNTPPAAVVGQKPPPEHQDRQLVEAQEYPVASAAATAGVDAAGDTPQTDGSPQPGQIVKADPEEAGTTPEEEAKAPEGTPPQPTVPPQHHHHQHASAMMALSHSHVPNGSPYSSVPHAPAVVAAAGLVGVAGAHPHPHHHPHHPPPQSDFEGLPASAGEASAVKKEHPYPGHDSLAQPPPQEEDAVVDDPTAAATAPSPMAGDAPVQPTSSNLSHDGKAVIPVKVDPPQEKPTKFHRCKLKDNTFVDSENEDDIVAYAGCLPLGLDDDKNWMSELHCYLRAHWAEVFAATEDDILAPMHGRNKPILVSQVGIRCIYCKKEPPESRGQQAVTYPTQLSTIYNSVAQMLRVHKDCCVSMPTEVRRHIDMLRSSTTSRGGKKQYWIDSAIRLGMRDTPHGIRFLRDPSGPLPPLSGPSQSVAETKKKQKAEKLAAQERAKEKKEKAREAKLAAAAMAVPARPVQPPEDARPLVLPEDQPLITEYLHLCMQQMAPVDLIEADQIGCYKSREIGFKGMACRHCAGQAGSGRYFPASEASLSQTTTSQTICNHVRNCRGCPIEIRESLELIKRQQFADGKMNAKKPEHGGRKVFFHRLWCRIHDIPFEEGKGERKQQKKPKVYKKPGPSPSSKNVKRKGRRRQDESDEESDNDSDTGSEEEDENEENENEEIEDGNVDHSPWFEGCVSLKKSDDPHWLSELECFVRSDLLEVFSFKEGDNLHGYTGNKEPEVGQVGIRCVFCKHAEPADRSSGCLAFPDMLYSIQKEVNDMIHKHFPTCPSIPDEIGLRTQQLKEQQDAMDDRDSQQYYVDAARDLGLANVPPGGIGAKGSWGITFRRDPSKPSPADELDAEPPEAPEDAWGENVMVSPADHGLCTDHVLLILKQVRPCRFRRSDRRAGPGSRGRDRALGFPGLACMHCAGGNSLGRYFPVNAKNLTDNTANSLQAHVSSCPRCPDDIQASLAFLRRRSILQKASLSGSWKKAFFNRVWDRLHSRTNWTPLEGDEQDREVLDNNDDNADTDPEKSSRKRRRRARKTDSEEENEEEEEDDEEESGSEEEEEDSSSEEEEDGGQMNALIAAAAVWLTEQDKQGKKKRGGTAGGRGRAKRGRR